MYNRVNIVFDLFVYDIVWLFCFRYGGAETTLVGVGGGTLDQPALLTHQGQHPTSPLGV